MKTKTILLTLFIFVQKNVGANTSKKDEPGNSDRNDTHSIRCKNNKPYMTGSQPQLPQLPPISFRRLGISVGIGRISPACFKNLTTELFDFLKRIIKLSTTLSLYDNRRRISKEDVTYVLDNHTQWSGGYHRCYVDECRIFAAAPFLRFLKSVQADVAKDCALFDRKLTEKYKLTNDDDEDDEDDEEEEEDDDEEEKEDEKEKEEKEEKEEMHKKENNDKDDKNQITTITTASMGFTMDACTLLHIISARRVFLLLQIANYLSKFRGRKTVSVKDVEMSCRVVNMMLT